MKKSIRVLLVLGALTLVMIITVPSHETHRKLLLEKMEKIIDETENSWFDRRVSKIIMKWMMNDVKFQDCLFFNLSYCTEKNDREYISIGMFNHVFFIPHKEYFEDKIVEIGDTE